MTTQNRITLKNIKFAKFASEETFCYEASVYFDGKRVGTVSNDGHGGCDYQYPSDEERWTAMISYIDTLPAVPCQWSDDEYPASLESICADLVADWLIERDAKKMTRGKVAFFEGKFDGSYSFFKVKNAAQEKQAIEHVRNKYPNATIINTLPMADRVALLQG